MASEDLAFMSQIKDCFLSSQSNQFLLTGNVNDLCRCPWTDGNAKEKEYASLTDYLNRRLALKRRLVINYNIARGIQFASENDRKIARDIYLSLFTEKEKNLGVESFNDVTAKSSAYIFPSLVFLRKLCEASSKMPGGKGHSIAIIFEHASSIAPNIPIEQMSDSDRQKLIFFKEWLTEQDFIDSDHLLVFISETSTSVNESIRSLPLLININIPLPDKNERKAFIKNCLSKTPDMKLKGSQEEFSQLSAGMTLLGIEQIMRLAKYKDGKLSRDDFMLHLNRLLVNRIGDYIELVRPTHTLGDVVGNSALKKQLKRMGKALKTGSPDTAPVGILVTGPNGVGKTYVAMAWACECDRIVLILKNLRGSYFGQTDQIFEKIRNVLEALGNVIIIVDEADTVFGKPGASTHETEQRLFGNVIKMMGDTKNRSRIIWILMTARPDNLAPDLKRSGRCGLHLPIFDPEGKDRIDFIDFAFKDCGLSISKFKEVEKEKFLELTNDYSPADFRELAAELKTEVLINKAKLTPETVLEIVEDFMPGNIGEQRKLQTLQAFLHCSRRSLLPESMKDMSRELANMKIAELKSVLKI